MQLGDTLCVVAGITGINCKLTIEDAPQPDILAYEIEESESADLKVVLDDMPFLPSNR